MSRRFRVNPSVLRKVLDRTKEGEGNRLSCAYMHGFRPARARRGRQSESAVVAGAGVWPSQKKKK